MFYQVKSKHPVKDESGQEKKEAICMVLPAQSYTEAEIVFNKEMELLGISNFETPVITKPKITDILCEEEISIRDDGYWWWKARTRYVSESENNKVQVFYEISLIYEETIVKALDMLKRKLDKDVVPGEIDQILRTDISHMVFQSNEQVSEPKDDSIGFKTNKSED